MLHSIPACRMRVTHSDHATIHDSDMLKVSPERAIQLLIFVCALRGVWSREAKSSAWPQGLPWQQQCSNHSSVMPI